MKQIVRDELLSTQNIDGILKGWTARKSTRPLSKYIPIRLWNKYKVQIEIDLPTNANGMTPLSSSGAEPPLVNFGHSRASAEVDAPMWKEKVSIVPEEVEDLRQIGTFDGMIGARQLLARKIRMMQTRLDNRIEYMCKQMIFDGVVTGTTASGITRTWTYENHPDFMDVTPAVLWNAPGADIVPDLLLFKEIWDEHSTFQMREIILPHGALRKMGFSTDIRDKALNNWSAIKDGPEGAMQLMRLALGGIPITESQDRIESQTQLMADAAAGATAVVLYAVEGLEVGATLTLVSPFGPSENVLVSSIVGKTVNFTSTPLQHDYAALSGALYRQWTIPLDTALILGGNEVPVETEGDMASSYIGGWAEMFAPLHLDNDMFQPKAGLFYKVEDRSKDHAASYSYSLGGKFIPVQYNGKGYMKVKIF